MEGERGRKEADPFGSAGGMNGCLTAYDEYGNPKR